MATTVAFKITVFLIDRSSENLEKLLAVTEYTVAIKVLTAA